MPDPLRLVCLVSGGGRTVVNLVERIADGSLPASIVRVIASRPDCAAVPRLRALGLSVIVVAPPEGGALWAAIEDASPELVCLCGFLHKIPMPAAWRGGVLNIHPSLLPAFGGKGMYGRRVHAAVLASGAKVSGCTVHVVEEEYDRGPIVVQTQVGVQEGDTPETLAARVFQAECEAYPEAIRRYAAGGVRSEGGNVAIRYPRGDA
ncbi:MAG: phosphoribosylglycinamide formyltransferase [Planctomycetaceae bacterium]